MLQKLGFLPGDLSQKIDPYLVPLFDSLEYFFGYENLEYLIEKRNIEIVNEANSYTEEVRKKVIKDLTYEKVYKQGFNINTPIDLKLQKIATTSLREGLSSYCLLYTSPSPRDRQKCRMPSSA